MDEPGSSDREEALAEHVGELLEEARRLHQQAMVLLQNPQTDPLPKLKQARALLGSAELRVELSSFPNGRHDDQADSISQFLSWHSERQARCVQIVPVVGI